jgi:hypothetical protein
MANHNTGSPGIVSGGMTIYYFQPQPPTKNLNVVAFAKVSQRRSPCPPSCILIKLSGLPDDRWEPHGSQDA